MAAFTFEPTQLLFTGQLVTVLLHSKVVVRSMMDINMQYMCVYCYKRSYIRTYDVLLLGFGHLAVSYSSIATTLSFWASLYV